MGQILEHSISGPQGIPLHFFLDYFDKGGTKEHPILGNLDELLLEINQRWDDQQCGLNLVAGLLEYRLGQLVEMTQQINMPMQR